MSGLRTLIQDCMSCPLFINMEISPVATEYFGNPPIDVLIVIGSLVKEENDKNQEVVMGPNREILKRIFNTKFKLSFATTFLVKCCTETKKLNKGDVRKCDWLKTEITTIKPKLVIGMGDMRHSDCKFDLITKTPHVEFSSNKSIDIFSAEVERLINDKHI